MPGLSSVALFEKNKRTKDAREERKRAKMTEVEKANAASIATLTADIYRFIEDSFNEDEFDIDKLVVDVPISRTIYADEPVSHSWTGKHFTVAAEKYGVKRIAFTENAITAVVVNIRRGDPKGTKRKLYWRKKGRRVCNGACKCVYHQYGFELDEVSSDSDDSEDTDDSTEMVL
jgi:hypothetical protein